MMAPDAKSTEPSPPETETPAAVAPAAPVAPVEPDEPALPPQRIAGGWLWAALGSSLLLHAAVIYVPVLQQAFSTVSLGAADWLACTAAASSVLWLGEVVKLATGATVGTRSAVQAGS